MRVDSQEQRELLMTIVNKTQIQVDGENIAGVAQEIQTLRLAINNATIEEASPELVEDVKE